jgi:integrase
VTSVEVHRVNPRSARTTPHPDLPVLLKQFPPRPTATEWAATRDSEAEVGNRILRVRSAADSPDTDSERRDGLIATLRWLRQHPGDTWQQRWHASSAEAAGNIDYRRLASDQLRGGAGKTTSHEYARFGRGVRLLLGADVIRPSLPWLVIPQFFRAVPTEMARSRDPAGFARLAEISAKEAAHADSTESAMRRIAAILAAKGGTTADITVGDCLQLVQILGVKSSRLTSLYFYQLLSTAGVFPAGAAPATVRVFGARGQLSVEELIDRYQVACTPVRDVLVAYLRERQLSLDYNTLHGMAVGLGKLFWKDLEIHHPGIDSLPLPTDVAAAWKQRIAVTTTTVTDSSGTEVHVTKPRAEHGQGFLTMVRAFYLDIAQWAMEDPATWGPWAAPCPIRVDELSRRKERSRLKSKMDQRTRERLPALPSLVAAVNNRRVSASRRLQAALAAAPDTMFRVDGNTLQRKATARPSRAGDCVWAEDPATGKRHDLRLDEHRAFWAWAVVEVLRHTGIRIEELTELTHHSLVQYRLPSTNELIPLLQIAPSKTDAERLLVVSPELAEVLSAIICRVRGRAQTLPLVVAYDEHERTWNPPLPLLFQRRYRGEDRPLNTVVIRQLLDQAIAGSGLTDAAGRPLHYTPHDFRRMFITDAILNGMPPHIAQLIAGHRDLQTTMGYKAIYPQEVINEHRAFIARRRSARPGEEYRTPTDEEWDQFLGHFERRKVAHGTCGRAFGTSCIHEHACIRCPMLRPDPQQQHRLVEVRDNLRARIDEAQMEGWLGEVEGLRVSLAGAEEKLADLQQTSRRATVNLGLPTYTDAAGRLLGGTSP